MGRKANEARLMKAKNLLYTKPGHKSGAYARMLGCHRETFSRLLVQLNDRGVLLSEDEKGRLQPFARKRSFTLKRG